MRTKYINACKELLTLPTSKHSTNVGYYFFSLSVYHKLCCLIRQSWFKKFLSSTKSLQSKIFLGSGFQISLIPTALNSISFRWYLTRMLLSSTTRTNSQEGRRVNKKWSHTGSHHSVPRLTPFILLKHEENDLNRTEPFFLVATPQCPLPTPLNITFSTNPLT